MRTAQSKTRSVMASLVALSLITCAGCGESVDPEVTRLRQKFLLAAAPAGEKPVSTVRRELSEPDAPATAEIVLRCRVDAGDFSPWVEGKAVFLATDATGHDGSEADHNPHECPFCSRDINSYMARIVFQDEDGNTIAHAAEQLFGLRKRQLVVIRGTGTINEQDLLVVQADGICVQP